MNEGGYSMDELKWAQAIASEAIAQGCDVDDIQLALKKFEDSFARQELLDDTSIVALKRLAHAMGID